jgi:hypothetical protein
MSWLRRSSLLVLVLLLGAGVGCSNDALGPSSEHRQPASPSFGLIGNLTGGLTGTVDDITTNIVGTLGSVTDLLVCSPESYTKTTETIGPEGGLIRVGRHSLLIPAGALDRDTEIIAEQIRGSTNSIRFSPEGLVFQRPAVLTMSYENCALVLVRKKIVYTGEDLKIREILRSLDLFRARIVSAPIDHFSRYAVAW